MMRLSTSIRVVFVAIVALCATLPMAYAQADDAALITLAKWELVDGRLTVVAPLSEALTQKQRSMINGGFTTVSQLSLRLPSLSGGDTATTTPFYSVRCTVKFDAWEETYDVARLDDQPRTALVKELGAYGDLCLKAEIDEGGVLGRLIESGGTVYAYLAVKQTSAQEASRIKDWLIQQQSGVMQSLFSHMLGELTLSQTLVVRISVPPKPTAVIERVRQEETIKVKVDKKG